MARTESVQSVGIVFGRWKLNPMDARNWELCELRDGKWRPLGRFYQYNSLDLALRYAADREMKDEAHGRVMELEDALHEYDRITRALLDGVRDAMGGDR